MIPISAADAQDQPAAATDLPTCAQPIGNSAASISRRLILCGENLGSGQLLQSEHFFRHGPQTKSPSRVHKTFTWPLLTTIHETTMATIAIAMPDDERSNQLAPHRTAKEVSHIRRISLAHCTNA